MRRVALVVLLAALAAPAAALASDEHPTLRELEGELMCPTCGTTLELSNAPAANQIRRFVRARIAAGDTKSEIEDKLVVEFGRGVLASPPKEGFDLLAWVLPLAGLGLGAGVIAFLVVRWSRRREPEAWLEEPSANGKPELDPALEQRLEDELARFEQ
jgi:cytochrome c-type biogenesis protein CcmH